MSPDILRDCADNAAHNFPEFTDSVRLHPDRFSGPGHQVGQVIAALQTQVPGISRAERLAFFAWLFNLPYLSSLKDLSIAQLNTLSAFRDQLGEIYASR